MKSVFNNAKDKIGKVVVDIGTSGIGERLKSGTKDITDAVMKIVKDDRTEEEKERARSERLMEKDEADKAKVFKTLFTIPGINIIESLGVEQDEDLKTESSKEAIIEIFEKSYSLTDPIEVGEVTYCEVKKRIMGTLLGVLFILPEDTPELKAEVDKIVEDIESKIKAENEEKLEAERLRIEEAKAAKAEKDAENSEGDESEEEVSEEEAESPGEDAAEVKIGRIIVALK